MARRGGEWRARWGICNALGLLLLAGAAPASAVELVGGTDFKLRWDNTLKYSTAVRVGERSAELVAGINVDDGDRNFDRGFISQRLDLLSELDLTYKTVGARVSGAGWYDLVYNLDNDNDSPTRVNSVSVEPDEFTDDTRDLHGRKAEILDAFVFANGSLGGVSGALRAGWHTLLWGESLLIADNGISYAQGPLDAIKALSVPGSTAKELFLPVGQISAQVQPVADLTLAGFYQFRWRRTRLPAAGSYFSSSDVVDKGGERLFLPSPAPPGAGLFRGEDLTGRNSGQWGASARYRIVPLDVELGVYFINFHDKFPQVYLLPGVNPNLAIGKVGEYVLVFPEDIKLFGGSFATALGALAVAGEVHGRWNTPLASTAQTIMPGTPADNQDNPRYAVGNTVHALLSGIYSVGPMLSWGGATLLFEAGFQRYVDITENRDAFDPARERQAFGFRAIFTPSYFQVLPNLDLSVPSVVTYNPKGKSPLPVFNGGAHNGGAVSLGISAEYRKTWTSGLQFSYFFGSETFQTRRDREFVSFFVQRTF